VETPGGTPAPVTFVDPGRPVACVPILRAGLALLEQAATVLPAHTTHHFGVARDETTLLPRVYYDGLPAAFAPGQRVLITDPMIATGGSLCTALDAVLARGAALQDVRVVGVLAAPPALKRLSEGYPGLRVYVACIDEKLDERGRIVPGLGDAGDRAFGTAKQ
jgi:uracil phosphoribosyltransferase